MVDYEAFLKKLETYYAHSKKYNDLEIDAIVGMLEKRGFTQHQLDQLYQTIIENMEHLPKLAKIRGIVDNPETGRFDQFCEYADSSISDGKLMSSAQILTRCDELHSCVEHDTRQLTAKEIDFIHRWGDLCYFRDEAKKIFPDEEQRQRGFVESKKLDIQEGRRPSYDMEPLRKAVSDERKNKLVAVGDLF